LIVQADGNPPFDAILFDLGSTLIYFDGDWPALRAASNARVLDTLLAIGLDLNQQAFLANWETQLVTYQDERDEHLVEHSTLYVLQSVLSEMGYTAIPERLLRRALAEMYAVTQQHWKVETDAHPTLAALRKRGLRLGLLSNAADDEDVQSLVDQAGLRQFFDFILTSAYLGYRKPHPLTFQAALDRWRLPPRRVAMVGDNLRADIGGARQMGIFSIWITRRAAFTNPVDLRGPITPDASIGALSELLPLLDELNPG
jgi:2-haloalkanoic acid dehalogenase type II